MNMITKNKFLISNNYILIIDIILLICSQLLVYSCNINEHILKTIVFIMFLQDILIAMYCLFIANLKQSFALICFNLAFVILLQGSFLCSASEYGFWGKHYSGSISSSISYSNEALALFYIQIAQFTIFSSYILFRKNKICVLNKNSCRNIFHIIRQICIIFICLGGVASFIQTGSRALFMLQYGYNATYLAPSNALFLNPFIDMFDRFFYLGLYGYMATFPKLKPMAIPILLFIIHSILSLMTGIRGQFVINLFFLMWYFVKRDGILLNSKPVVTYKMILILTICIMTILLPFLLDYGYSRSGWSVPTQGHMGKIIQFVDTQGYSGKLVALGLENKEKIYQYTSPTLIILAPVRNFILNNSFIRMFSGGLTRPDMQRIHSIGLFGAMITFVVNPNMYFKGGGLGSSFVAELAVSYGITGIIIFCILLGILLSYLDNINPKRWAINVLLMNAFGIVIYMPRAATLEIIPASIIPILFVCLIKTFYWIFVKIKFK